MQRIYKIIKIDPNWKIFSKIARGVIVSFFLLQKLLKILEENKTIKKVNLVFKSQKVFGIFKKPVEISNKN